MPTEWEDKVLLQEAAEELLASAEAVAESFGRLQVWMGATPADAAQACLSHWQKVLWAEEMQLTADLGRFNLIDEDATVLTKHCETTLELKVAGLAEKHPLVIKGDKVCVCKVGEHVNFEGLATFIAKMLG